MKIEKDSFQFWPLVVVAVAAIAGIAWLCYPVTTKTTFAPKPGLPAAQAAQAPPDHYGARLNAAEEKLNAWSKDKGGIMARITQVEKSASAGVRRARSEATALV